MRATDVTDEKVREYVRKRQTDGSVRGQVKGSTIGRKLNLLRRRLQAGHERQSAQGAGDAADPALQG